MQVITSGVAYAQLLDDFRALIRHELTTHAPAAPAPEREELLNVRETAREANVCVQTVHEWKRKGILPWHKLGGRTLFKRSEVLAALKQQTRPDGRRKNARKGNGKEAGRV